nr:MFS transporter [Microbacterium pseudoresistens]
MRESIWSPRYLAVTLGAVALIFLGALEALAVTTVMPVVSADLDGQSLYAVAFAGTLATGVVGMVAVGAWTDRAAPRAPVYTATALFILGLLIAGLAQTMPVLLAGRLVQGLGAGGQTVALYVVVARLYPPRMHGRVFAVFSAAWVVPSMVGPALAGAVTELLDWRWTFLGVAALAIIALVAIIIRLRAVELRAGDASGSLARVGVRMLLAVVVAVAAIVVGLAVEAPAAWRWPVAASAVVVLGLAVLPLLPRGTLRSVRGLPSVILMRALIAGAFFAAEAYIPYLLMDEFSFSPTYAGLVLTGSALSWSFGSWVQGQWGERLGSVRSSAIGLSLLLSALAVVTIVALAGASPLLAMAGWALAGGGMGLLYPMLNVLMLAYSTPADEGFNSSALSIADATGSAVIMAVAGLVFGAAAAGAGAFAAVYVLSGVLILAAAVPGLRLGRPAVG